MIDVSEYSWTITSTSNYYHFIGLNDCFNRIFDRSIRVSRSFSFQYGAKPNSGWALALPDPHLVILLHLQPIITILYIAVAMLQLLLG